MIIRAKAPLRLGLAGGGTDVSPYSDIYGGCILNVTIDMYAYCTIIPTTDGKIIFSSQDRKETYESTSKKQLEIDKNNCQLMVGVYNRIIKEFDIKKKLSFKMTTYSDAPTGSGLGSSSTMVVCILKAFTEWLNLPLGQYDMARLAYEIERKDLGLHGGKQDQYAATFGGFNFMEFNQDDVIVNPLKIKKWIKNEMEAELIIYYTGTSRESAKIIDDQIKNTEKKEEKSLEAMHELKKSAIDMKNALLMADFDKIADILKSSWEAKKQMAKSISNNEIDKLYDFVIKNGAKAAKISGAGGGGFMMILCDPSKKYDLMKKLETKEGIVMAPTITEEGTNSWVIYD